ncbi:MAG: DUF4097 family beta strand repeat protein [Acidimicrobiales bacterium]|nr:DUF4097 family beta strand repeat protein [Acidimicrobiales bacterium]
MRRALFVVAAVAAVALVAFALLHRDQVVTTVVTEPIAGVVVETGAGTVTVAGSERTDVQVRVRERYLFVRPDVELSLEGGQLRMRLRCPRLVPLCSADVLVEGPSALAVEVRGGSDDVAVRGVSGRVDVRTGPGDVEATDIDRSLLVQAGSGDVSVRGLAGDAELSTGSGDLIGSDLTSPSFSGSVGSGQVTLAFVAPPTDVGVRVGAGDVEVRLPGGPYAVDATSGNGQVDVRVPTDPAAPASVAVRTGSGDVAVLAAEAGA